MIINKIENYLNRFVSFSDPNYTLPIALWTLCTFIYPHFDAFPYMVITSETKRSGKSRLSELMGFVCSNPMSSGAMTPASIFQSITNDHPTIFFDEAEVLSQESASVMRSVLNMGYRKGQTVVRMRGNEAKQYEVYCPKVFILIGDVYDTLRDRSIIVRMLRGEPKERFTYEAAKMDGEVLRTEAASILADKTSELIQSYVDYKGIEFLTDRDEEIWTPLFVMCEAIAPERMKELRRVAIDMSTEKTAPKRAHYDVRASETEAEGAEYADRLVNDMRSVIGKREYVASSELLPALLAIDIAPWRKFQGKGLSYENIGNMLKRFGISPRAIRIGSGKGGKWKKQKVVKGYTAKDLDAAIKDNKL